MNKVGFIHNIYFGVRRRRQWNNYHHWRRSDPERNNDLRKRPRMFLASCDSRNISLSSLLTDLQFLEWRKTNMNKKFGLNYSVYVCLLQILAIWVQVPPRNTYFDQPAARGRQNHVHKQGPVLWNHTGVHSRPGQAFKESDSQGKCNVLLLVLKLACRKPCAFITVWP